MKYIATYRHDEDGGFIAECPALPGCITHGETLEQARANLREAIELWLETWNDLEQGQFVEVSEIEIEVS